MGSKSQEKGVCFFTSWVLTFCNLLHFNPWARRLMPCAASITRCRLPADFSLPPAAGASLSKFRHFRIFGRNFSAPCREVCPWGSLRKSCKNRIQLLGTAAGLYNTDCSSPKYRLSWDGMSLLPFHKHYPEPGGGRRTIRPHFIAALAQRPPRASRGEPCLVAAVRPP